MNALFCQEAKLGIALTRYSTTLWRPNRRIHALKAKALLSGSGMERGFGSVFRHHPARARSFLLALFISQPEAPCSNALLRVLHWPGRLCSCQ